ncbi:FAD-dependent oxidoreductase [Aspergillus melleus]|uniref:FAD-dependent oxidoreductase n=1 Tax=Aspergillus melleus TaxID=138277 RepID=UPI001E8E79EE|nr:uncharacterized protein LDX57_000090 [Aspergillus melleus]KAH8422333.1 hypothetical protein LDX57_000090 [Aspergillus melleus]
MPFVLEYTTIGILQSPSITAIEQSSLMEIGIIGAGVIGLTTALVLSEAGHKVTILARAGAGILPHPDGKGHDLQTETFIYFWALAHRDSTSGVQVVNVTEYYDDRPDDSTIWYKTLVPNCRQLHASELRAIAKIGFKYQSMTANLKYLLPWITKRLEKRQVRFIRKEVSSIPEARSILKSELIVNATALGALHVANDQNVHPVRGQIMHVRSDAQDMVLFQRCITLIRFHVCIQVE